MAVMVKKPGYVADRVGSARAPALQGEWPAEGCQLHVVFGPEDDIRVSEVWESAEKQQAFGEKLGPRMEKAGMQLSGEVEVFEALVFETF
jgi:hypothetical protein